MICYCENCENNDDGYCARSSYVCIDENGMCDSCIIIEVEKDDH